MKERTIYLTLECFALLLEWDDQGLRLKISDKNETMKAKGSLSVPSGDETESRTICFSRLIEMKMEKITLFCTGAGQKQNMAEV